MTGGPRDQRGSARRLLGALALTSLLLGPFTYLVYDAGLAQSTVAIAGTAILLALAIGVAWASHLPRSGAR